MLRQNFFFGSPPMVSREKGFHFLHTCIKQDCCCCSNNNKSYAFTVLARRTSKEKTRVVFIPVMEKIARQERRAVDHFAVSYSSSPLFSSLGRKEVERKRENIEPPLFI